MAPKRQEIKVVSYVHTGERLVSTEELDPEGRQKLAVWLKGTYLNTLYEGKARFWPRTN